MPLGDWHRRCLSGMFMIIKNKLFDAYRRIFDSINTGVAQQDVCPAIRFLQDDQNNTILLT